MTSAAGSSLATRHSLAGLQKVERDARILGKLSDEIVIILVRANPKPDDKIAMLLRSSTIIMIADPY